MGEGAAASHHGVFVFLLRQGHNPPLPPFTQGGLSLACHGRSAFAVTVARSRGGAGSTTLLRRAAVEFARRFAAAQDDTLFEAWAFVVIVTRSRGGAFATTLLRPRPWSSLAASRLLRMTDRGVRRLCLRPAREAKIVRGQAEASRSADGVLAYVEVVREATTTQAKGHPEGCPFAIGQFMPARETPVPSPTYNTSPSSLSAHGGCRAQ